MSGPVPGVGTQPRTSRTMSLSPWCAEPRGVQGLDMWVVTGMLGSMKEKYRILRVAKMGD